MAETRRRLLLVCDCSSPALGSGQLGRALAAEWIQRFELSVVSLERLESPEDGGDPGYRVLFLEGASSREDVAPDPAVAVDEHSLSGALRAAREHVIGHQIECDLVAFIGARNALRLGLADVRARSLLIPLLAESDTEPHHRLAVREARWVAAMTPFEQQESQPLVAGETVPWILPSAGPSCGERISHKESDPLVLYIGDVTRSAGCDLLVALWSALRDRPQVRHKTLGLVGRVGMPVPRRPDLRAYGVVSAERLPALLRSASAVVTASASDRVGLSMLKGWAQGVPALVPAQNRALSSLVTASGGGLSYSNAEEFIRSVNELMSNGSARGTAGRDWLRAQREARNATSIVEGQLAALNREGHPDEGLVVR